MLQRMSLERPAHLKKIVSLGRTGGGYPSGVQLVSFSRRELSQVLGVYSRMLTSGQARDYAIDHLRDRAVFSIFRRTSETPLYRIEKRPKDAQRQGAYSVVSTDGGILKRGRELDRVLKVFERKLIRAVD